MALPDGTQHSFLACEEKGIDVRIALDVIALAHRVSWNVPSRVGLHASPGD